MHEYKGIEIEFRTDDFFFYIRYKKNGKWYYGWSGVYVYPYDDDTKRNLSSESCVIKKFKSIFKNKLVQLCRDQRPR